MRKGFFCCFVLRSTGWIEWVRESEWENTSIHCVYTKKYSSFVYILRWWYIFDLPDVLRKSHLTFNYIVIHLRPWTWKNHLAIEPKRWREGTKKVSSLSLRTKRNSAGYIVVYMILALFLSHSAKELNQHKKLLRTSIELSSSSYSRSPPLCSLQSFIMNTKVLLARCLNLVTIMILTYFLFF